MQNILEVVNEALRYLGNYGFCPMTDFSESFLPGGCSGNIVLEINPSRGDLRLYTVITGISAEVYLTLLMFNGSDEASECNRFFLTDADSEDRSVRLGRVIHIGDLDTTIIRDEILDFLDSSEEDRRALNSFISEPDPVSAGSDDLQQDNGFTVPRLLLEV